MLGRDDPARPATIDEDARADFASLGVDVDENERRDESDVAFVWDINWPSLCAFLACETQWRVLSRGMSGRLTWLGIDYQAARPAFERRSKRRQRQLFEDLRVMEREALNAFAAAELD